jgi:hypothetical protein
MRAYNNEQHEVLTHEAVRIMLRPIASSLPRAFFAFGGRTMLRTALELKRVRSRTAGSSW